MLDLAAMQNLPLRGGFLIVETRLTSQFLLDPLGRPATAQTVIRGSRFHISLRNDLTEDELSISLYHEILEAATVAADSPPEPVLDFNEGDFERVARSCHARLGVATPGHINQMLAEFGFGTNMGL